MGWGPVVFLLLVDKSQTRYFREIAQGRVVFIVVGKENLLKSNQMKVKGELKIY